ncbi:MAG: diaminopimelate epimerase [Dorea sp.]|jgi:diaminopimelate epimerase|nr:diaminopimelate epimerase [Dorea sp.]
MYFTKMHGLGNDYVYVNCFAEYIREPERIARQISDRHFGVGSDGLILIGPSKRADFKMEIYNADGSRAEMCGNGIRCLAKYVYEHKLTDKKELLVETLAGIRRLWLRVSGEQVEEVTVDMGYPILQADKIPIISENSRVVQEKITIHQTEYRMTGVSMGNPHAVVYVKRVKGIDLERMGPEFEYHGRFPKRVNVEFAEVTDRNNIKVRVWERGAGETMACGTGACASVVASVLNDLTERQVTVKLKGGELTVLWSEKDGKVYMTGPAVTVYDGEIRV